MAPAATSKTADSQRADDTRGRPYYEKLRKDLRQALDKKRDLDSNLALIESNIAAAESRYLEETSTVGNIVKGFDNYIKASGSTTTSTGPGTATRRKGGDAPAPLILPSGDNGVSSVGTPSGANVHSGPSSARGTPGASTNKPSKKKKAPDRDKDDEADERPSKRQQVSWSRD
ncbi:MAG: hypothetical protein M1828_004248 [Chrysothrix sp. TS-e1954]|nr:MAG: hypothetical protein M1828_004248 [Chrysothrix sp. TS-e1954]